MDLSNTWDKVGLYILSLLVLFVFIIFLTLDVPYCFGENCEFVSGSALLSIVVKNFASVLSLIGLLTGAYFYFRFENEIGGGSLDVMQVEMSNSESYEHLVFLATYILPFIGFTFDEPRKTLAYFLLLAIIGLIFIRTDKYYANPTLALLGYKLFKVDVSCRGTLYKNMIIISKNDIEDSDQVNFKFLSNNVCFARKIDDSRTI